MITKVTVTYDDGSVVDFNGTPAVPAVPAVGVDLSVIPTQSPAQLAVVNSSESESPAGN